MHRALRLWGDWGDRARAVGVREQVLQRHFGGVFLGVVDVLPVVPVAGGDVGLVYRDGRGPGCAAACEGVSEEWSSAAEDGGESGGLSGKSGRL